MPALEKFDSKAESVADFVLRLEVYCAVQEIEEDADNYAAAVAAKKRNLFLSSLRPADFSIVVKASQPQLPTQKTLPQLQAILEAQYQSASLVTVEVVKFNQRFQRSDESLKDYINAISDIAAKCQFADVNARLRERLMTGTINDELQKKMLAEPQLTFEQACTHGLQFEAVASQASFLKEQRNPDKVYKVSSVPKPSQQKTYEKKQWESDSNQCGCSRSKGNDQSAKLSWQKTQSYNKQQGQSRRWPKYCWRCLGSNHSPHQCKTRNYNCRVCGKRGHIAKRHEVDNIHHVEEFVCCEQCSEEQCDSAMKADKCAHEQESQGKDKQGASSSACQCHEQEQYYEENDESFNVGSLHIGVVQLSSDCELGLSEVVDQELVAQQWCKDISGDLSQECEIEGETVICEVELVMCGIVSDSLIDSEPVTFRPNMFGNIVECADVKACVFGDQHVYNIVNDVSVRGKGNLRKRRWKRNKKCLESVEFTQDPDLIFLNDQIDRWKSLEDFYEDDSECQELYALVGNASRPLYVKMLVSQVKLKMELDIGAARSIMSLRDMRQFFPKAHINYCLNGLKGITGIPLNIVGDIIVSTPDAKGKLQELRLVIINTDHDFIPLLGREWLDVLTPTWRSFWSQYSCFEFEENIFHVDVDFIESKSPPELPPEIVSMMPKYPNVFGGDMSKPIVGFEANVVLKPDSIPVYRGVYPLPYAIQNRVTHLLREQTQEGRWIPTTQAPYASPMWPIVKPNGSLRLITDYKRTLNPHAMVDHYPIPTPDFIYANLQGGDEYCEIDLLEAFQQLAVSEKSPPLLTANTCLGLMMPTRLPFGYVGSPAIFQSVIDQIISGMSGVVAYVDNLLIKGKNRQELLQKLTLLFEKFEKHNVRVNINKCKFFVKSLPFLGRVIDSKGTMPSPKLMEIIKEFPSPQSESELRSYLGVYNFFCDYVPNRSTFFKPLTNLLEEGTPFVWTDQCDQIFQQSKVLLSTNSRLVHFDPNKEMVVTTDASPHGIGAVLNHRVNNKLYPIVCKSATLTNTQQRYSQLEREALAIVFALRKFNKYLMGREFVLITDNVPIKSMFSPSKDLPLIAAARVQRWAVILGAYAYKIEYAKSKSEEIAFADALSRMPQDRKVEQSICAVVEVPVFPLNSEVIMEATVKDPILSKVTEYVHQGWPPKLNDKTLKSYFDIRFSLSLQNNCLLFGDRICVPESLQQRVLELLHEGHPGMTRMKMKAQFHVFWPGIDKMIENYVRICEPCALVNFRNTNNVQGRWSNTHTTFARIHLDFFYFNENTYLLLIDSHTKWLEVWHMSSTVASEVIETLRTCFSIFGLPTEIVTDNGPPFTSFAFIDFCTVNNIILTHSPPYHPESNGLAERWVQTAKRGLRKELLAPNHLSLKHRLSNFLFANRTTPCTVNNCSPAQMMFKHTPKSLLTSLKPPNVTKDYLPKTKAFAPGDNVIVKLQKDTKVCSKGTIVKALGSYTYEVNLDGKIVVCSVNQLNRSFLEHNCDSHNEDQARSAVTPIVSIPLETHPARVHVRIPEKPVSQATTNQRLCSSHNVNSGARVNQPPQARHSSRSNFGRPPNRYGFS